MKAAKPQKSSRNYRGDFLLERRIAHRGLHSAQQNVPENSLVAFAAAVEHKYAIELDVHLSKDGRVVVMHDNRLERMTGAKGRVTRSTYTELQKLKLSGTNQGVPLLEEVLRLVDGRVPVVVELKNFKFWNMKLEEATVEIMRSYSGKYAMKSFNPMTVRYLRKHHPEIVRGQLVPDFKNLKICGLFRWLLEKILMNSVKYTEPDFISCELDFLRDKRIREFRKKGLVLGWTVKNKADLAKAQEWCDNVIFEGI